MCGESANRSPPHDQYEVRRNGRGFESQRNYGPRFPPRGARTPPVRRERISAVSRGRVPLGRCGGVDFTNPSFEQMARHWFDSFCTNLSVESFAHSRSRF